jgi:hypothetical protein
MTGRSLNFFAQSKKKQRPEARLQKTLVQHVMLTAVPGLLWFSIPNEGKRSVVLGAELKAMGLRPGAADLCFILNGRAHFLELKSEDGRQTSEQVVFAADCAIAGAYYSVVRSIGEALTTLSLWGVIRGLQVAA